MLIKFGTKGENVERVQRALNDLGYEVKVDSNFRNETYEAVRKFQEDNGLEVDGKVGEDTLTALGLDPETLEPLTSRSGGNITVITEEPIEIVAGGDWSDTAIPSFVQERIKQYMSLVSRRENHLLSVLGEALDNFETTMSFASAADAKRDIFGSMVSTAFEVGVDILWGQVVENLPRQKRRRQFSTQEKIFSMPPLPN